MSTRRRTTILGISAFYHDSAACLVVDGDIVAAAQEERFTRKKHDPSFPTLAVRYCLKEGGVAVEELDYVVFYETRLPGLIREGLGGKLKAKMVFTDHHESHAASAFFPSPFDEAAILTLDGV